MVTFDGLSTDELLRRAEAGEIDATEALFQRHRDKLRRMVEVRLDPRLIPRLDPSDVVQETLAEAARQWRDYLQDRSLPFYPWLRSLAWNRLVDLHRRHVTSQRRSITREQPEPMQLSDVSLRQFTRKVFERGGSPSEALEKNEQRQRVRLALESLPNLDRDVLLLRHMEQLSVADTAHVLQVPEGTVKSRQYRALKRLKSILGDLGGDNQ